MFTKNTAILSCGLLMASISMYGIVAPYTPKDKKNFEDLVNVSFTKSALATKARKAERVKELQQLDALMIQRLASTINGAEFHEEGQEEPSTISLKEEYKTAEVLAKFANDIKTGAIKPDLVAATKFATNGFEKAFEEGMEKIFQKNLKAYESSEQPQAFKELLADAKQALKKSNKPFTLLNFEFYVMYEFYNAHKDTQDKTKKEKKELLVTIARTLHPDREQIITELEVALRQFNTQYRQIVAAMKEVDKKAAATLPSVMTFGYLKRGAVK